jgi:mannonate dehydratase
MYLTQTLRWFGPEDRVRLSDIRQCGATEVVTALHEIRNGDVWTREAIAARKAMIEDAGLSWTVVESLPVHESIKTRGATRDACLDTYRRSLENLAACGIRTVTYNFMPLLDWTRTDLAYRLDTGVLALRFEWEAVATYDIHILHRPFAEADYSPAVVEAAARRFAAMSDEEVIKLERTIIAGLPGSEESFGSPEFLAAIGSYAGIDAAALRANHVAFLEAVCPTAEAVGIQLVVHPDDPPFPLFGLPRVVSVEADFTALFEAVPSVANGLCFCTGSLGVRADNDLPGIIDRLGARIGFFHLRSVQRQRGDAFFEAEHLGGDADMTAVMSAAVRLAMREHRSIPMRPDHGHQMLDDLGRRGNPGYSLIGRMRGLAELRGLEIGVRSAYREQ